MPISNAGNIGEEGILISTSNFTIIEEPVSASTVNGGNPLSLNEESVPAIWLIENPSWKDSVDDETVMALHVKVNREIAVKLELAGLISFHSFT